MAPEITVAAKDFPALVALVWLVVRVGEEMGLEVRSLVEAPLAYRTLVRGLLHVEDLMDCQGAGLTEALAALGTFEWLLLRVDVSVVSEMVLPSKGLSTEVTRIGPLVSVGPFMDEEVV